MFLRIAFLLTVVLPLLSSAALAADTPATAPGPASAPVAAPAANAPAPAPAVAAPASAPAVAAPASAPAVAAPAPGAPAASPTAAAAAPVRPTDSPAAGAGWPGFRGPLGTGAAAAVPASLPASLQPVWKKDLKGKAYSGVVTDGQRVVVPDWEEGKQDIVRCFSADKGDELWTAKWPNTDTDMDYSSAPRATPVIADGRVFVLGSQGDLQAIALADGKTVWAKHLVKDLKGALPTWGFCASPLVVDGKVIAAPGGAQASIVALDAATGNPVWSAKGNPANYGSPIVATVGGKKQIIAFDEQNVVGLDPADGRAVWTKALPDNSGYVVPSPVVAGDLLVVCADHGASGMVLSKAQGKQPDEWQIENANFLLDTSSPVVAGNLVVGCVMGKGVTVLDSANGLKEVATCEKPEDLQAFGNLIWGNDRLLDMTTSGALELLTLDKTKCERLGGAKICGNNTMSAPALVASRFYVRDEKALYCFDLGGGK